MSGLKILLVICISVFVGNVVLMLLENAPMNIWIIRLIGGVACAISGILLTNYFQKRKVNRRVFCNEFLLVLIVLLHKKRVRIRTLFL